MTQEKEVFPIHPIVDIILYGKCRKTPWDVLGDKCLHDDNGNIDIEWANSLDEEQTLRMDIAATIQEYFNNQYRENARNYDLMKEMVIEEYSMQWHNETKKY